jgi:erythritol kinase
MMAAVAIGAYRDMDVCIAEWTTPLLAPPEPPDPELIPVYERLFTTYRAARAALTPVWRDLSAGPPAQGDRT